VLAENQGVNLGASACGHKVGVAEDTEAVSYDPTNGVELVLCHEAPKLRQSCRNLVRTVAGYHRGVRQKELTEKLSLQLRPQTVHANPACAGINVKGLRREKLAQQTARTENTVWCGCEVPAMPNKVAEYVEQTSGSARIQVTRPVLVPAELAKFHGLHPVVLVLVSLEKQNPRVAVVFGNTESLLRGGAGTIDAHVPDSSMCGKVSKLFRRATIEIAVHKLVLEFGLREDDVRNRDIWIRAWNFGVDSVGMDVIYEQKRGPVFILIFNFGGEVDLLPERQVFDDRFLDLCRSLNHQLDGRSAFC